MKRKLKKSECDCGNDCCGGSKNPQKNSSNCGNHKGTECGCSDKSLKNKSVNEISFDKKRSEIPIGAFPAFNFTTDPEFKSIFYPGRGELYSKLSQKDHLENKGIFFSTYSLNSRTERQAVFRNLTIDQKVEYWKILTDIKITNNNNLRSYQKQLLTSLRDLLLNKSFYDPELSEELKNHLTYFTPVLEYQLSAAGIDNMTAASIFVHGGTEDPQAPVFVIINEIGAGRYQCYCNAGSIVSTNCQATGCQDPGVSNCGFLGIWACNGMEFAWNDSYGNWYYTA
jgi:hypothetical protein